MVDAAELAPPPGIDPDSDALFLDLDGTLAPIMATPEQVVVSVAMRRAFLRARTAVGGRIALVSGRTIAVLDYLMSAGDVAAAGVHGLERRTVGHDIVRTSAGPGMEAARACLTSLVATRPRLRLEDKGLSLALHFRGAPELETTAFEAATAAAEKHGLVLQAGKMVYEVRAPGGDKGAAVRAFMAETPFAGARPIFVGDDETDESAFRAATDLGGYGILVGQPRATAALYRLVNVDAVQTWLSSVDVRACGTGDGA